MIYTVIREVIQKNKVISHQNVFDDIAEAREFYDGTNGILSVCLYDENGTLISFKGEKFETPEPTEEISDDPVVETVVETSVVTETLSTTSDVAESVEHSDQQPDTESMDISIIDETSNLDAGNTDDADSTESNSTDPAEYSYTDSVATETVPDTVIEDLDQDLKLEFVEVIETDVSDSETTIVDDQESEEYVQAEFNTVTTESNDKLRQLVLEEPIINKINTAPTYSFINKN